MSQDDTAPAGTFGWPWTMTWPLSDAKGASLFNFAPDRLWQPINPGWSFGNLIVNQQNSSAPEVEQALVSRHSYGRQIGRLMEAVTALTEAAPKTSGDPRIRAFAELAGDIEKLKAATVQRRVERLRKELEELKASDPAEWDRLMAAAR